MVAGGQLLKEGSAIEEGGPGTLEGIRNHRFTGYLSVWGVDNGPALKPVHRKWLCLSGFPENKCRFRVHSNGNGGYQIPLV